MTFDWYVFVEAKRMPSTVRASDKTTAEATARVLYGPTATVQSCADYREAQAELEASRRQRPRPWDPMDADED